WPPVGWQPTVWTGWRVVRALAGPQFAAGRGEHWGPQQPGETAPGPDWQLVLEPAGGWAAELLWAAAGAGFGLGGFATVAGLGGAVTGICQSLRCPDTGVPGVVGPPADIVPVSVVLGPVAARLSRGISASGGGPIGVWVHGARAS